MNANTRKAASLPKLAGYERCAHSTTTTWLTQKPILDSLSPVDLDPCVPPKMPWRTATRMLTVKEDGLATPWPKSAFVFHNPPYGKNQDAWMAKAAEHGNGVTLVMARFDTRWMHEHVLNHPATTALVFVKGRMKFCRADGTVGPCAPAPSIFIAYGQEAAKRLERAVRIGAIPGVFFAITRPAAAGKARARAANDDRYSLTPRAA